MCNLESSVFGRRLARGCKKTYAMAVQLAAKAFADAGALAMFYCRLKLLRSQKEVYTSETINLTGGE
jgi:hypothetical protein